MTATTTVAGTQPTLSVVVPMHDAAAFLPQLLTTLARSGRDDVEYLFVDDHSTDSTLEILRRSSAALGNARVIELTDTTGPSAGRNRGLREASAPFVTYMDADDWVAPGYLEDVIELARLRDVDVMRVDHIRAEGSRRWVVRNPTGKRGVPLLGRDLILPVHRTTIVDYPTCTAWGAVFRRSFLLDHELFFHEDLITAEDRDWWWRVVLADGSMTFENLAGYVYRRGVETSLTHVGDDRQLHYFDSLEHAAAAVSADRDSERFLPKMWRGYLNILLSQHWRAERLDATTHALQNQLAAQILADFPAELARSALVDMAKDDAAELVSLGLQSVNLATLPLSNRSGKGPSTHASAAERPVSDAASRPAPRRRVPR